MCLLFVHLNPNPSAGQYRLILVNNRDETYNRPTKHAHLWSSGIYAGMDLEPGREGGTWLGINKQGKLGCLLNILQSTTKFGIDVGQPRGLLVVDYLNSNKRGEEYLDHVSKAGSAYKPFNLITFEPLNKSYILNYYTNQKDKKLEFDSGTHGFGNSAFDKPFLKVKKGRKKLEEIVNSYGRVEQEEELIDALKTMMQDMKPNYPDAQIIEQGRGYPEELLRALSATWVTYNAPPVGYGSRTTTVILVAEDGRTVLREWTKRHPADINSTTFDEKKFTFSINS